MDKEKGGNKKGEHKGETEARHNNPPEFLAHALWNDFKGKAREVKFWMEVGALSVVIFYTVFAGCQTKIARDTFNAANRPYIGVNTVGVSFISKDDNGKVTVTEKPDERTYGITWRIEIKNFGPVPGSNYTNQQRTSFGGVEQPLPPSVVGEHPRVIFPSQSLYLIGGLVGEEYYKLLVNGSKVLAIEVGLQYNGPSSHYEYCDKRQYDPRVGAFMTLGVCE